MIFPEKFRFRLKWALYDWIGAISQRELLSNPELARRIDMLCKRLSAATA
jgi:hypothetical protein